MATQTVTIYGSGSARTESANPNKANTAETIIAVGDTDFGGSNHIQGYEKFVAPASIRGKKAVSAVLHVYARRKQVSFVETTAGSDLYAIDSEWDPARTTYNQPPAPDGGLTVGASSLGSAFSWREFPINAENFDIAAKISSFGVCFHNYFEYYTSNSDHKPYIVVTVQDGGGMEPLASFPTGGVFVNNRGGVKAEWRLSVLKGTIEPVAQTKAVVTWTYNGTTKTATINGAAQTYTIPASQLPETGTVTWKVTTTDNGGNTRTSDEAAFTTTDATCYAQPTSPINAYVDGSKPVTLAWTRSISTGSAANGADFQASGDGGTTWKDLGHTQNYADFVAAPGTLPAGNVLWRVRGYNTDGVAGPWSSAAAIVVRQAPNTPVISGVTSVPRPTVTWQAEGQQAYQLQVGPWDSGTVYGTAKSAQVPVTLPNGGVQVRLRVQNSFGLWSQWAAASVTIANRPGAAITLTTRTVLGGVRLTWATQGTYQQYAILRDGKEIAVVTGKEYTDYTGIGKCRYIVRGSNADSTYTDSPPVVEILRVKSGIIAQVGVWDWLRLDRRVGSRPSRGGSEEADATLTWFSGRSLPVAELSGHRQASASYAYTVPSLAEVRRLRKMTGQKVVYKHQDGEVITGLLGGLSWSRNRGRWDVSFTITEVDHGPLL